MGTKLNPDGAKIRAFRIQRGWTQEQLAEIAGISLRTVQRAEAANSAAFETIKAIAAAFETDFDRLLKQEHNGNINQELRPAVGSGPQPEKIAPERPASRVWRIWPTQIIAVSALALGLVIGISFTSHLNEHSQSLPTASLSVTKTLDNAPAPFIESRIQNNSPRTLPKPKAVLNSVSKATSSNLGTAHNNINPFPLAAGTPASTPVIAADTTSLDLIRPSSADLLSLEITPMPLTILEVPLSQTALSDNPGFTKQGTQDAGAVRQAVSLAAKKTGGFVSRARDSIKRAF